MSRNNLDKSEVNYRIAEIAVKECCRNPSAYTAEECMLCQFHPRSCNQWQLAEKLVSEGYQKVEKTQVVIDREYLEGLEANYDKVYEQARADIMANIKDGGASCYLCMDEQRKLGAEEVIKRLKEKISEELDKLI